MSDTTLECPQCKATIRLTESLAAPLLSRAKSQYDQQLKELQAGIQEKEAQLQAKQAKLERDRLELEEQVAVKLRSQRAEIAKEEEKKVRLLMGHDLEERDRQLRDLREILKARDAKLEEAMKAQADLMRKERELQEAKAAMDVTIQSRVNAEVQAARDAARLQANEEVQLKLKEKDETIESMRRKLEEAQKKAEQGSQQLQGEALELVLEAALKERFPLDKIEPVPKGVHGGDILQHVVGPTGQACGTILWESKRAKSFAKDWLVKLRDDQRAAKAEFAVLVSQVLPPGARPFDRMDEIWLAVPAMLISAATALRHAVIELTAARMATLGQETKMELVYKYATGPSFTHRVRAVAERLNEMRSDLEKERRAITKQWSKREKQIQMMMESTAGLFGDVQAIVGQALPEIEQFDLKLLEVDSTEE